MSNIAIKHEDDNSVAVKYVDMGDGTFAPATVAIPGGAVVGDIFYA